MPKPPQSVAHKLRQRFTATRLSGRYLRLATLSGILVLLVAITASIYVARITQESAARLKLRDQVERLTKDIRKSVSQAELALQDTLFANASKSPPSPLEPLARAQEKAQELAGLNMVNDAPLHEGVAVLVRRLASLDKRVRRLLTQRRDLNWRYPALPFINGSMLRDNERFEAASNLALAELHEHGGRVYKSGVYQRFYEANDLWRRIILNFRAMLIRYSGLQNVPLGQSAEEHNIDQLYATLGKTLGRLETLREQGQVGIQGEESLDEMRAASHSWMQGLAQLGKMRLSLYWRGDVEYLIDEVRPYQSLVYSALDGVETAAEAWSRQHTAVVENSVYSLTAQLWGIALIVILMSVMGYRLMHRLILKPVADVSRALRAESRGGIPVRLAAGTTDEIAQLVEAFSAMRQQVSERQQALEYQALHDSLTGLPNRVLLHDRLSQQIAYAQRNDESVALLLLDLNGFKVINDTLGHQVGDQVLKEVASRLGQLLRSSDTIARLGGDEFAIVLAVLNRAQTEEIAEKIARVLAEHMVITGHRLSVGASLGIALYPQHGSNARILVQRADVAMYLAKRGKKSFVIYDRKQDTHDVSMLTLPAELDLALREGWLAMHYQPKLDLRENSVIGVEALLRWKHPRHGWVNPEDVVNLAENTGKIDALSSWVLEQCLADCAHFRRQGINLSVAMNLSPYNLHDSSFLDSIVPALQRYHLPGECLTLELTENALITDPAQVATIIHVLRSHGVRIAIDDFGTGFSSFSYLKQLSVNEIKIDKSFVLGLTVNEDDKVIVRSTLYLAKNLRLTVVAEGVETAEAMVYLSEQGCDQIQGYYLSRPLPRVELLQWLGNRYGGLAAR